MENSTNYYKAFFAEYWKYIKSFKDWNTLIFSGIIMVFGAGYYLFKEGVDSMIAQTENFLVYTFVPLIVIAFIFILWGFITTPYKLFNNQNLELAKYKWSSVALKIDSYSMVDGSKGWALIIKNKKSIPITGFLLRVFEISEKGKIVFHHKNKLAWFGYIYQDDGYTREKVVFPREINLNAKNGTIKTYSQTLESGKEYIFVLTKYLDIGNQVFFISNEKINIVPKNIVLKLNLSGAAQDNNETYYHSDKQIEVLFDKTGKPKILN